MREDQVLERAVGRDGDENFSGKGVHEAARIAALADGGQILASRDTAAGARFTTSEPQEVRVRGITEPIEVVVVDWS